VRVPEISASPLHRFAGQVPNIEIESFVAVALNRDYRLQVFGSTVFVSAGEMAEWLKAAVC